MGRVDKAQRCARQQRLAQRLWPGFRVTDEELSYLRSQGLAPIATIAPNGQPGVVPVAYEYDESQFWVGGSGASVTSTRKFRNVAAGAERSRS
jgi:PPOX class F420-dependent enzyme/OxyR family protein